MAKINGTNVAAKIVPFTTEDQFATHEAQYGKGGWREVATIAERDAITTDRREAGMAVYVLETNGVYILDEDLTTWTELETGGGSVEDVEIYGKSVVENKIADLSVVEQLNTIPAASEDLAGRIVQYTGITNQNYTHGYFYECKVSGAPSEVVCTGTDSSTLYPYHITIDKDVFETQITTEGEYMFHYNGTNWTLDNNVVSLDDYGISIQEGVTYSSGDNIYIQYTESTIDYFWSYIPVQPDTESITNAEIDEMWSD